METRLALLKTHCIFVLSPLSHRTTPSFQASPASDCSLSSVPGILEQYLRCSARQLMRHAQTASPADFCPGQCGLQGCQSQFEIFSSLRRFLRARRRCIAILQEAKLFLIATTKLTDVLTAAWRMMLTTDEIVMPFPILCSCPLCHSTLLPLQSASCLLCSIPASQPLLQMHSGTCTSFCIDCHLADLAIVPCVLSVAIRYK